jgi:CheY-like chemotaxis protein
MNNNPPILLAEDDENDAFLLKLALERTDVSRPLIVARDGQQAVDYLNGETPYTDRARYPSPAMLLLDLKMPRMDGFDVLTWLHAHPDFKALPVIVLTSSALDSDIEKARQLGADDYRVKPPKFEDLLQIIQELNGRWLEEKHKAA